MIAALSIRQPWAWLIVNGYKDIENRDWPTKFRGRMLVHAPRRVAAVEAERPRLGAALGQDHELLGPFVHAQLGVGPCGLHGGADYEFVAVSQIHAAFLIGTLLSQFASITARPRGGGTALPHMRTWVDLLNTRPSWPRSMM